MNTLRKKLAQIARVPLIAGATPIERLSRIEQVLGEGLRGICLYAKRDDLMGLGGGGNKLRKLEFLLGEALAKKADTIIAIGGRQSNHARLTAAATARLGLTCELVLKQLVPRWDLEYQQGGNVLLDTLFGASIIDIPSSTDALEFALTRADSLRIQQRAAYVIPSGGSSPVGCLGYAACAQEIVDQSQSMGIEFDHIVVPNGSSGTHAGLLAGLAATRHSPRMVRSFAVLSDEEQSRRTTLDLACATLSLLDQTMPLDESHIDVIGTERGPSYGATTASMLEAVRLMATQEGLLLDPVYSGKAFAGLLAGIRRGDYAPGENVLFIMTGGTPGLFSYRSDLAAADDLSAWSTNERVPVG